MELFLCPNFDPQLNLSKLRYRGLVFYIMLCKVCGFVTYIDHEPVKISRVSLQTIDSYSDQWIHVYTDCSAFWGTSNAGYGILIHYPDGSSGQLSGASNYDAEIAAIETACHFQGRI